MRIEYFREFVALAKYLNFSTSAELMHITQSVLSRHLVALEEDLDVTLFHRNTKSVSLTKEGEIFLERITKILNDYDDLKSILQIQKLGYEGFLSIGVPYYARGLYLGEIPEQFEELNPSVRLRYEVGDPYEMLELLYQDKVDIIIIPKLEYPHLSQLIPYEIFQEKIGILVSAKNPLAAEKECTVEQLEDQSFVSVDNDYFDNSWKQIRDICRLKGFEPKTPEKFNKIEAAIIAVQSGDGILTIGEHMRIHESPEIAYLELTNPCCVRPVCMWCKKGNTNKAINKFVDLGIKSNRNLKNKMNNSNCE